MRNPNPDAMLTAAEWLDVNEGESGEKEDCHAVATWLRKRAAQIDEADQVRQLVSATGTTAARARRAYREACKEQSSEVIRMAVKVIGNGN